MDRCRTAETPRWEDAETAQCVATLRAFAAVSPDDKGFVASRVRDCDARVNQPKPTCPEQVSCVNKELAYAAETVRAHGK
jgi:hypothetical protein